MAEARAGATIDDLYRTSGKAELVDGELVLMSPTGFLPGRAGGAVYRSLVAYEEATGRGYAIPDNVAFVVNLPRRKSFSPDAAFYVGTPIDAKFLDGAPLFAVEVRSEGDYGPAVEKRLAQKRDDYFAAGTSVGVGRRRPPRRGDPILLGGAPRRSPPLPPRRNRGRRARAPRLADVRRRPVQGQPEELSQAASHSGLFSSACQRSGSCSQSTFTYVST